MSEHLAIRGAGRDWATIHRVAVWARLEERAEGRDPQRHYVLGCGQTFQSQVVAVPLDSGVLSGPCCTVCWRRVLAETEAVA